MKKCIDCNLELDDIYFKKYTRKRCIECHRNFYREYEKENKDRLKERQREYQRKNIEHLRKKRKEYRKNNKERINENYKKFMSNNPNYNAIHAKE